jgi:drug/metabolite transporter (DMT)-like permease
MSSVMTGGQIASVVGIVGAMVAGQILFKLSSQHLVLEEGPAKLLLSLLTWEFVSAMVFYSIGTFLWVVLLKYVPLSRAYPFVALSFALLPIAAHFLFDEPITARYASGLAVFLAGLYLVATA